MGGSGSGNRWQSGKPTTANYNSVDVRRFARDGFLTPGTWFGWQWTRDGEVVSSIGVRVADGALTFSYRLGSSDEDGQSVQATAPLEWTPCHYGGSRPWFRCPSCYRRCAKLYLSGRVGCQACFDLAYESQREDAGTRALTRAQDIRVRLGGSPSLGDFFPEKPKGMHWRTYLRLWVQAENAEAAWWGSCGRRFRISI